MQNSSSPTSIETSFDQPQSVAESKTQINPTQHGYPNEKPPLPTPLSDPEISDNDDPTCIVCTELLTKPLQLKPCNHSSLCGPCLNHWATTKATASPPKPTTCPLCAEIVISAIYLDSDEVIDIPTPETVEKPNHARSVSFTSTDLLSLDHDYFLTEVERMLGEVEDARRQRLLSGASAGKRSSVWEDANDALLMDASVILGIFRGQLIDTAPFDPVVLLGRLTAIQDALKIVWRGPDAHAALDNDPSMALVISASELGDPFDPLAPIPLDSNSQDGSRDGPNDHDDGDYGYGDGQEANLDYEEHHEGSWSSSSASLQYSDDFIVSSKGSASKSSSARKKARKARKSAAKAKQQLVL